MTELIVSLLLNVWGVYVRVRANTQEVHAGRHVLYDFW